MENEFAWLLKTSQGDFYITVVGDWTEEEAKSTLMKVVSSQGLVFTAMIPRKRCTVDNDYAGILEQDKSEELFGCRLTAGRQIWKAFGREAEFDKKLKEE